MGAVSGLSDSVDSFYISFLFPLREWKEGHLYDFSASVCFCSLVQIALFQVSLCFFDILIQNFLHVEMFTSLIF